MIFPQYYYFWAGPLFTVILETAFFALVGYRKRDFLLLCAAVNTATTLALNMVSYAAYYAPAVELLGVLVAAALEYLVYALAIGRSKKLLLLTLAANAISFLVGELYFWYL